VNSNNTTANTTNPIIAETYHFLYFSVSSFTNEFRVKSQNEIKQATNELISYSKKLKDETEKYKKWYVSAMIGFRYHRPVTYHVLLCSIFVAIN
jgi:hypothetical protein